METTGYGMGEVQSGRSRGRQTGPTGLGLGV